MVVFAVSTGDLAGIVTALEDLKIDFRKMKGNDKPHVSESLTDMGLYAMKQLKNSKLWTKFEGSLGMPSLMTGEDVEAMVGLSNEYASNCYVQCKLVPVFDEIGLSVVNSERPGFEWLQTFSGESKCDKRPDLIICDPCFYEARHQPGFDEAVSAVQVKLLGNDSSLLFGIKAGHPLQFLDDISMLEGKKQDIKTPDVGQVKTYSGLQARLLTNPVFHRIALFDCEKFILFLSKGTPC